MISSCAFPTCMTAGTASAWCTRPAAGKSRQQTATERRSRSSAGSPKTTIRVCRRVRQACRQARPPTRCLTYPITTFAIREGTAAAATINRVQIDRNIPSNCGRRLTASDQDVAGMPRGRNRRSREEETHDRGQGQAARHSARFADSPLLVNLFMRRFVLGWKNSGWSEASALAS